jgi:chloride channel protein, CIC family
MAAVHNVLALIIELTHAADTLILPMVIATMPAMTVARYLGGYSLYTSRLPAQSPLSGWAISGDNHR